MRKTGQNRLLKMVQDGLPMSLGQQLRLTVELSIPAIISQLSSILMQFIDASMVGSLGAEASASIGLVSTTTWLFAGISAAAATGFYVQVSHLLGSKDTANARSVLRQSIVMTMIFSAAVVATGCAISWPLPRWLGGEEVIRHDASMYFLIFMLSLPALQLNMLASGIAALGTALASAVVAAMLMYSLCVKSPELAIAGEKGSFRPTGQCFRNAIGIALPMGCERGIMCGAQIMSTVIIAPLGTIAIAANSFAITVESLCYMPGHGVSNAATTLVGQSIGARRRDLTWRFAHISVLMGIAVMTVMGIIMYATSSFMMGIMTPNAAVRELGATILKIEAFAEPMYAASIVVYGVFVGAGDTLVPSIMNLCSIWAVRLSLAAFLAPEFGLEGVWVAMCVELCFRGIIFLIRLYRKKWLRVSDFR